jgi:serine/threonine protein phosphatase PrpC
MPDTNSQACPSCGIPLDGTAHLDDCILPTDLVPLIRGINSIRCPSCNSREPVEWEGYCPTCGEYSGPNVLDENLLKHGSSTFAISNRGIRHKTNQDSIWIGSSGDPDGEDEVICIVVCDGVSSAYKSEFASRLVTHVTGNYLIKQLSPEKKASDVLIEAAEVAKSMLLTMVPSSAVPIVNGTPTHDVPSATIVVALIQSDTITVGWLGDSRAYWLTDERLTLLTSDDSYATILIEEKKAVTYVEALNHRLGHAITACIAEDCPAPLHVKVFPITEEGTLILCSDGLWNYLIDDVEFRLTVNNALQSTPNTIEALHNLVQFACDQGGIDNISIAVYKGKASTENQQTSVDFQ